MTSVDLKNKDALDFDLLSDEQIRATLAQYQLALTIDEAKSIQQMLGRPPTIAECVLWSIQASEHCAYKSSKSYLKTLITEGPNVILGAKEDAGIIHIATDNQGEKYGLVMSHESHNHPSQVVPKEGAATGIGGNVRDVSCMGAEVIAVADSLRFGDISLTKTKWVHHGVIDGIASYANPIGVPNISGDVFYHPGYNDNCLVTVVTLGLVKGSDIIHSYAPEASAGFDLILVGKPTDMSGFGGASFASLELDEDKKEQNRGAVQEPNAFLGRMLLKANAQLFKKLSAKNLIDCVGFKDLGAGGVACASVELADHAGMGADVQLDQVHTAIADLPPAVILCSETQERYMWVCPPDLTPMILDHYNQEFAFPKISNGACASVIGKITEGGQYKVSYKGETLVNAKASDITRGIVYDRPHENNIKYEPEPDISPSLDLTEVFKNLLQHVNIASAKLIYEHYDKQVQGRTVIERGMSDAGVIAPFNSDDYPEEIQHTGVALSVACNPRFNDIDPFYGAYNAVIEAMYKLSATGATPEALTDCLCFGNPEKPEHMADFVAAIKGIKFAAENIPLKAYRDHPTPIVAGNVSFYNESKNGAIPASPMISAVGSLKDVRNATHAHFQHEDSIIVLLGERQDECGGSVFYETLGVLGNQLPKPDPKMIASTIYSLTDAISCGLLRACRVITLGGVAITLAKMSFANTIGFAVDIPGSLPNFTKLFSETPGFVLEVHPEKLAQLKSLFAASGVYCKPIGRTSATKTLSFAKALKVDLSLAKELWENGLRENLS